MCRSHEVTTYPKEIVDRAVDGEKALGVAQRFEAMHVAFALACGLMGHLSAVVSVLRCAVTNRGEGGPMRCSVTAEFIGD